MAKSYIPQLAKRLQELAVYITKHEAKMREYSLSTTQLADLGTLKTIASDFSTVQYKEEP